MRASEIPPAVADRVCDVQCFAGIHITTGDSLAENIHGIAHPAESQTTNSKVVCTVVISDEAPFQLLGEIDSFRLTRMCRRRATPIIEADLELQYATKVVGLGRHGSRQPRGMEDGVATGTHRSRVPYFVGHCLGPVRWIEVAVSCLKDVEALDCTEMPKSHGVAEIGVRHVGVLALSRG